SVRVGNPAAPPRAGWRHKLRDRLRPAAATCVGFPSFSYLLALPIRVPFHFRDFRYSPGVASPKKLGLKEDIDQVPACFGGDEPRTEGDDIGIVVLAGEPGLFVVLRGGGAYTVHLIRGDCHADARRANQNPAITAALSDVARHSLGEIGIVAGLVAIGAEIH